MPEYAIRECGAKAIEFKFGQSAKGTQPANLVPTLEEALKKCEQGFLVLPDPRDPGVQEAYGRKACPAFHVYGRLPIWSDDYLIGRIAQLRDMGMANVYFKMRASIQRIWSISSGWLPRRKWIWSPSTARAAAPATAPAR